MELSYNYKTIDETINRNINKYCKLNSHIVKKRDYLEIYGLIIRMAHWYYLRYNKKELEYEYNNEKVNKTWADIINYDFFYNNLNDKQKKFLDKVDYPDIMDILHLYRVPHHFYLDEDGCVIKSEAYPDIVGMSLKEVAKWAKKGGFINYIDFINVEERVSKSRLKRKLLLESVMLQIIKDGGKHIGIRRALLFAKEFALDMNKALYYGISSDDIDNEEIKRFYKKYSYDNKEGVILIDYLSRERNREILQIETIEDYMNTAYVLKK